MTAFNSVNMMIALLWLFIAFIICMFCSPLMKVGTGKPNTAHDNLTKVADNPLSDTARLGKSLFKANCASCHNKNMLTDMTGPALKGVTSRWAKFPQTDLYSWIKNSEQMIEAKHPRAIEIFEEWNEAKMTSMMHLSDEDIANLLEYIES